MEMILYMGSVMPAETSLASALELTKDKYSNQQKYTGLRTERTCLRDNGKKRKEKGTRRTHLLRSVYLILTPCSKYRSTWV